MRIGGMKYKRKVPLWSYDCCLKCCFNGSCTDRILEKCTDKDNEKGNFGYYKLKEKYVIQRIR